MSFMGFMDCCWHVLRLARSFDSVQSFGMGLNFWQGSECGQVKTPKRMLRWSGDLESPLPVSPQTELTSPGVHPCLNLP